MDTFHPHKGDYSILSAKHTEREKEREFLISPILPPYIFLI